MLVKQVKLKELEDIKAFVTATTLAPFDVDLRSDRFVVDAKSILGIFSLNLAHPITMNIHSVENEDTQKYLASIEAYLV